MSSATTTAVNATSSSSASSSLLPQYQQAPVHHNNHPHSLASTLQQLFQSPPQTSLVNHPMMVPSLQAVRCNILINTILVFNHCITIAALRCPWQQFFFYNIPTTAAAASTGKQYTVAYAVVRSAFLQQVIIRTAGS